MEDEIMEEFVDEKITVRLGQLGKDVEKFKAGSEIVHNLSRIWDYFKDSLDKKVIESIGSCFQNLLRHSAKVVFNVKYQDSKKVDEISKSQLIESVRAVSSCLVNVPAYQQCCSSLILIVKDPWTTSVFTEVSVVEKASDLKSSAIENLWASEGWLLLEERMETMFRAKIMETVVNILHCCITKGNEWYSSDLEDREDIDDKNFNPFRFSYEKYLEYLQAYGLLWHKNRFDSNLLSSLTPKVSVPVLKCLRNTQIPHQLLSKLWKGMKVKEVLPSLVDVFLWGSLKKEHESEIIEELLFEWVEVSVQDIEESEKYDKMNELIRKFVRNKVEPGNVLTSDYAYSFAEVLLKKFGLNKETKIIFLQVFVGTMTDDMNMIEIVRAENDAEKLDRELKRLSQRELRMADFFKDYPKTSREFCLTAFSLNPTHELFDRLFPENSDTVSFQTDTNEAIETTKTETEASASEESAMCYALSESGPSQLLPKIKAIQLNSSKEDGSTLSHLPTEEGCDKIQTEELELPPELLQDVETLMTKPRWTAVGHFTKEDEQKRLCSLLLQNAEGIQKVLIKGKQLEYVNVDYEKYKHLPSKYDPNDDGIEKGYGLHERKKIGRNGYQILSKKSSGIRQNGITNKYMRRNWKKNNVPLGRKLKGRPPKVKSSQFIGSNERQPKTYSIDIGHGKAAGVSRKSVSMDLNTELRKLKQFVHQSKSLSDFFLNIDNDKVQAQKVKNKIKKMKIQYVNAYTRPKKVSVGEYDLIPVPKTYVYDGINRSKEVSRKNPTRYTRQESPYHLKIHGIGEFEVGFRIGRQRIPTQHFLNPASKFNVKKERKERKGNATVSENKISFPKTTDNDWLNVEEELGLDLTASGLDKDILSDVNKFSIKIQRDSDITTDLQDSTKRYLSLKNEAVTSKFNINTERPVNTLNTPKKKWLMVDMELGKNSSNVPGSQENDTDEDCIEFAVGEVWEFAYFQKRVTVPPGPKRFTKEMEKLKKQIMINDASERMANNLKLETYRWDSVVANGIEDLKAEKNLKDLPENLGFIGPLTEEEQRKCSQKRFGSSNATDSLNDLSPLQTTINLDQCKISANIHVSVQGQHQGVQETADMFNKSSPKPKRPRKRKSNEISVQETIETVIKCGNVMGSDDDKVHKYRRTYGGDSKSDRKSGDGVNIILSEDEKMTDDSTGVSATKQVQEDVKVEINEDKPKENYRVTFPFLANPLVRKAGELAAGKPIGNLKMYLKDGSDGTLEDINGTKGQAVDANSIVYSHVADFKNLPENIVGETEMVLCEKEGNFILFPKPPVVLEESSNFLPWEENDSCDNKSEESEDDELVFQSYFSKVWEGSSQVYEDGDVTQKDLNDTEGVQQTLDHEAGCFSKPKCIPLINETVASSNIEIKKQKRKRSRSLNSSTSQIDSQLQKCLPCYITMQRLDPNYSLKKLKNVEKNKGEPVKTIEVVPEVKRSTRIMSKKTRTKFTKGVITKVDNKDVLSAPLVAYGENGRMKNARCKIRKPKRLSKGSDLVAVSTDQKNVIPEKNEKQDCISRVNAAELPQGSAPGKENVVSNVPSQSHESNSYKSVARKRTGQQPEISSKKSCPPRQSRSRQNCRRKKNCEDTDSDSDYNISESELSDISDNDMELEERQLQRSSSTKNSQNTLSSTSNVTTKLSRNNGDTVSVPKANTTLVNEEILGLDFKNDKKVNQVLPGLPKSLSVSFKKKLQTKEIRRTVPIFFTKDPLDPNVAEPETQRDEPDAIELSSDSEPEEEKIQVPANKFVLQHYENLDNTSDCQSENSNGNANCKSRCEGERLTPGEPNHIDAAVDVLSKTTFITRYQPPVVVERNPNLLSDNIVNNMNFGSLFVDSSEDDGLNQSMEGQNGYLNSNYMIQNGVNEPESILLILPDDVDYEEMSHFLENPEMILSDVIMDNEYTTPVHEPETTNNEADVITTERISLIANSITKNTSEKTLSEKFVPNIVPNVTMPTALNNVSFEKELESLEISFINSGVELNGNLETIEEPTQNGARLSTSSISGAAGGSESEPDNPSILNPARNDPINDEMILSEVSDIMDTEYTTPQNEPETTNIERDVIQTEPISLIANSITKNTSEATLSEKFVKKIVPNVTKPTALNSISIENELESLDSDFINSVVELNGNSEKIEETMGNETRLLTSSISGAAGDSESDPDDPPILNPARNDAINDEMVLSKVSNVIMDTEYTTPQNEPERTNNERDVIQTERILLIANSITKNKNTLETTLLEKFVPKFIPNVTMPSMPESSIINSSVELNGNLEKNEEPMQNGALLSTSNVSRAASNTESDPADPPILNPAIMNDALNDEMILSEVSDVIMDTEHTAPQNEPEMKNNQADVIPTERISVIANSVTINKWGSIINSSVELNGNLEKIEEPMQNGAFLSTSNVSRAASNTESDPADPPILNPATNNALNDEMILSEVLDVIMDTEHTAPQNGPEMTNNEPDVIPTERISLIANSVTNNKRGRFINSGVELNGTSEKIEEPTKNEIHLSSSSISGVAGEPQSDPDGPPILKPENNDPINDCNDYIFPDTPPQIDKFS